MFQKSAPRDSSKGIAIATALTSTKIAAIVPKNHQMLRRRVWATGVFLMARSLAVNAF